MPRLYLFFYISLNPDFLSLGQEKVTMPVYVAHSRALFRNIFIDLPSEIGEPISKMNKFIFVGLSKSLAATRAMERLPDHRIDLFAYHKLIHQKTDLLEERNLLDYLNFFIMETANSTLNLIYLFYQVVRNDNFTKKICKAFNPFRKKHLI